MGAREYDPRTARWLQRDPIDTASGDPNLYRYCGNDPVAYKDPDGLKAAIAECAPCAGIPSGLIGFGGGLEYALNKHNRPTQHGFARLGYYIPGAKRTQKNFQRTFHWDWDPKQGTHFNAEAGPLKIFDSHRRFPRGVPIKGLPPALRHLGHTRVLRCIARGSLAVGVALDAIDIATAKPCNRGRAIGRAVGGAVGAFLGGAIGSSIAPGAGTFIGGAVGGVVGGIIGDRIGALFDPPCEGGDE
ncbi:MAG: hypothetical protein KatS3mg054_1075 [Chloroflexus sp.]|nr:MAG: hypothetical protein KatS3mg054_1075 [Chloroflexus sp.]